MPIRHKAKETLEQQGDEPIICKVCLSVYDDSQRLPLVLNCRHSYCASCIADSLMTPEDRSKVFCPLCKSKTTLDKRGIAGLPVNEESMKLVENLVRRKQMEQMQMERPMGERPDWGRSPYDNVPTQTAYPLAANKNAPGKPKGILKVQPKAQRLERTEFRKLEAQPGSGNDHGRVCRECAAKIPSGNETGTSVSQQHTVVVKSANRLHPPPNSSDPDSESQKPLAVKTTNQEPLAVETTNQKPLSVETTNQEHSLTEDDHVENHEVGIDDEATMFGCSRQNEVPGFLKPLSESLNPSFLTPDTTPDPFRISSTGDLSQPGGRIYPVNALLYMASADGIPLEQFGSSGAEVNSEFTLPETELNDSQKALPSGAKYVGRFGKYSDKRQPGSLNTPQRIACSQEGSRLAVTDPTGLVVHVFTTKGEFICCFPAPGMTGAVCFLADDQLAVATEKGVQMYTANGTLKKAIPLGGVLGVASFKQGFVAASRNRISVCKSVIGSVIHSINGKRGTGIMQKQVPFEDVVDIAVGSKDELYILETNVVLVTNEEGVILLSVQPDQHSLCGPIGRAAALAICSEDRSIVVADAGHRRVLQFGADGQFVRCLLNLNDLVNGVTAGCSVSGIAVNRSRKMYCVSAGKQVAEVRVFAI